MSSQPRVESGMAKMLKFHEQASSADAGKKTVHGAMRPEQRRTAVNPASHVTIGRTKRRDTPTSPAAPAATLSPSVSSDGPKALESPISPGPHLAASLAQSAAQDQHNPIQQPQATDGGGNGTAAEPPKHESEQHQEAQKAKPFSAFTWDEDDADVNLPNILTFSDGTSLNVSAPKPPQPKPAPRPPPTSFAAAVGGGSSAAKSPNVYVAHAAQPPQASPAPGPQRPQWRRASFKDGSGAGEPFSPPRSFAPQIMKREQRDQPASTQQPAASAQQPAALAPAAPKLTPEQIEKIHTDHLHNAALRTRERKEAEIAAEEEARKKRAQELAARFGPLDKGKHAHAESPKPKHHKSSSSADNLAKARNAPVQPAAPVQSAAEQSAAPPEQPAPRPVLKIVAPEARAVPFEPTTKKDIPSSPQSAWIRYRVALPTSTRFTIPVSPPSDNLAYSLPPVTSTRVSAVFLFDDNDKASTSTDVDGANAIAAVADAAGSSATAAGTTAGSPASSSNPPAQSTGSVPAVPRNPLVAHDVLANVLESSETPLPPANDDKADNAALVSRLELDVHTPKPPAQASASPANKSSLRATAPAFQFSPASSRIRPAPPRDASPLPGIMIPNDPLFSAHSPLSPFPPVQVPVPPFVGTPARFSMDDYWGAFYPSDMSPAQSRFPALDPDVLEPPVPERSPLPPMPPMLYPQAAPPMNPMYSQ